MRNTLIALQAIQLVLIAGCMQSQHRDLRPDFPAQAARHDLTPEIPARPLRQDLPQHPWKPTRELLQRMRADRWIEEYIADRGEPWSTGEAEIDFDWSMADRFGLDENDNGFIDLPNTAAYALNGAHDDPDSVPRFRVRCEVTAKTNILPTEYHWSIQDEDGNPVNLAEPTASNSPVGGILAIVSHSPKFSAMLPEGNYVVSLTAYGRHSMDPNREVSSSISRPIIVNDILFVSIGDSMSSGEGNPEASAYTPTTGKGYKYDQEVRWADDGVAGNAAQRYKIFVWPGTYFLRDPRALTTVARDHLRSHRSTLSWPAQAALLMERADPKTSVTFISLAASGASVENGLIGPYSGSADESYSTDDHDHPDAMPAQITQARNLLAVGDKLKREIDILTISIGVNDIGFTQAFQAMMINGHDGLGPDVYLGYHETITNDLIWEKLISGNWPELEDHEGATIAAGESPVGSFFGKNPDLDWETCPGLYGIGHRLELLEDMLVDSKLVQPSSVYICEYPDLTMKTGASDIVFTSCPKILTDLKDGAQVGPGELELVRDAATELNQTIHAKADEFNWNVIPIHAEFHKGHGYCASEPPGFLAEDAPGSVRHEPPTGVGMEHGERAGSWQSPGMRWFRTLEMSTLVQGPLYNARDSKGLLHPNEYGHRAIADAFLTTYAESQ